MHAELTDRESLRRRLEATYAREHGPRFYCTADGWRRRSDGAAVSSETVNHEAATDNATRAEAWARWSALDEADALVLACAHEPDEIGAWAFLANRDERELLEALAELLHAERQWCMSEHVVPDARLEALARGFWLIAELHRDHAAGLKSEDPLAPGLGCLRGIELLEAAAAHEVPRGHAGGGRDAQRRLEYARRRARRAVE